MNSQLQEYVSPNADQNMSYSDAQKLVGRLRTIGVVVSLAAQSQPGAYIPAGGTFAGISDLKNMGMQPSDLLNYVIQVANAEDWNIAAWVAADLAPLTGVAIYKVMSDLFPGNAQGALATGLMMLPGIDQFIATALS